MRASEGAREAYEASRQAAQAKAREARERARAERSAAKAAEREERERARQAAREAEGRAVASDAVLGRAVARLEAADIGFARACRASAEAQAEVERLRRELEAAEESYRAACGRMAGLDPVEARRAAEAAVREHQEAWAAVRPGLRKARRSREVRDRARKAGLDLRPEMS